MSASNLMRVRRLLRPAVFLLPLFLFIVVTPIESAAPRAFVRDHQGPEASSWLVKQPKKKSAAAPAVVQNVRVVLNPDSTQLVLDLQRSVIFTQRREPHSGRVIIQLQNASLSKTALSRLTTGTFPQEIAVEQSNHASPSSVLISLNMATIRDYKLLPLENPPRLVVELFNRQPEGDVLPASRPAVDTSAVKPAQPVVRSDIETIVIDPGHGGKDPGAVGRNGTEEKDITLQVGLLLRELLIHKLGKRVLMTRDRDVFVELEDRAKFANSQGADLFVSIHVNAHPQRATKGVEIYHFGEASDPRALAVAARENGTPIEETGVSVQYLIADLLTSKKMELSQDLAFFTRQALVSHLSGFYDVVDHGVKTGPFYVLRFTAMPSMLAEIAFISNPTEERLMQGQPFLSRVAEGLFAGINTFINPLQNAAQ